MTYGTINRGVSKAQLVMEAPPGFDDGYQMAMIAYNDPNGFLPVSECCEGEVRRFYYDVTGSNPLSTLMIHGQFDRKEIVRLMEALCNALESANIYLLDDDRVNLDPNYIYAKGEQYLFCYVPFGEQTFEDGFRNLTMFIIDHVDSKDEGAAELASDLYRAALSGAVDVGTIRALTAGPLARTAKATEPAQLAENEEVNLTDAVPWDEFKIDQPAVKPRRKRKKKEDLWDLNKRPDSGVSEWGDFGDFLDAAD